MLQFNLNLQIIGAKRMEYYTKLDIVDWREPLYTSVIENKKNGLGFCIGLRALASYVSLSARGQMSADGGEKVFLSDTLYYLDNLYCLVD